METISRYTDSVSGKHNHTREEDFEGVEVEMINLQSKPKEEVVEDGTSGHSIGAIYATAH